jgi:hypothetical protein
MPLLWVTFPLVLLCWGWLPARWAFAALWLAAWPTGMFLLSGYGDWFDS